ncbi:CHAT domain-containing protein [Sphingomonas sp. KR3-1]|uniref:CHAT domain-containing protein n=1 Tax=Sphingomonas sp. KR3-1 TaxID=3156611 RepID=UPI0032B4F573
MEKEINLLQEKLDLAATSEAIDLRTYSYLSIDSLPDVIARISPDILHFAAHGQDDTIVLAHAERGHVALDGDMLSRLLAALSVRPKLVVINACNSNAMARKLAGSADFVIGTNAAISNVGARTMTATLYGRLANAASLQGAFDAAATMLDLVDEGAVAAELHSAPGQKASHTRLVDPLRIVARFPLIDKWLEYGHQEPQKNFTVERPKIQFGFAGTPPSTRQAQFFTDDGSLRPSKGQSLADARSWLLEAHPAQGEIWIEPCFTYYGTMRWYGSVVTAEHKILSASSDTVAALERYYFEEEWQGPLPAAIAEVVRDAVSSLALNDGSRRSRGMAKMDLGVVLAAD